MGPIWGRQGPGGPHVDPMNFAIWVGLPCLTCLTMFPEHYIHISEIYNNAIIHMPISRGLGLYIQSLTALYICDFAFVNIFKTWPVCYDYNLSGNTSKIANVCLVKPDGFTCGDVSKDFPDSCVNNQKLAIMHVIQAISLYAHVSVKNIIFVTVC